MKKTIWKYELELTDKQFINIQKEAELLSVQTQNGKPCLWAMVKTDNRTEQRCFEIFGTGHSIPLGIEREFIGTFQMSDGALVFHLFERY